MMADQLLFAIICGTFLMLVISLVRVWSKNGKWPTGPKGWPLVGNAFQQNPIRPHLTWEAWADKYGDVFTIYNFGEPLVICKSFEAIWEMFVTKSADFADRPNSFVTDFITGGSSNSLSFSTFNPEWVQMKKMFKYTSKMYGEGHIQLESIMVDIVNDLVEALEEETGHAFDPLDHMRHALGNALSLMLFGRKFERHDPDLQQFLKDQGNTEILIAPSMWFNALNSFPWLRYIPFQFCQRMNDFVESNLKDWFPRMLQKRMVNYDANHPGCALDDLIKHFAKGRTADGMKLKDFKGIITLSQDFLIPGMNSGAAYLYSTIAILVVMSDIQERARQEVDDITGNRHPLVSDMKSMPYMQAMLEEVFRYTVVSLGLPHQARKDSQICGHFIPRDTEVMPNIWYLCHDAQFWKDPWLFRPERFLDADGHFLPVNDHKRKRMLIFGAGLRMCPAEQLARNRLFLIITSLLQKFVLLPADDAQLPQHDPRTYQVGIVIKPQRYKIRAIPRHK